MSTTARPRSRRLRTSWRTWRVCGTPSAAVGSSSRTTFGSPSSERAIATCWRWPPDIVPTSERTLGIVVDSVLSSSRERCSIAVSSSTCSGPVVTSLPMNRFSTTSRLSHRARSW